MRTRLAPQRLFCPATGAGARALFWEGQCQPCEKHVPPFRGQRSMLPRMLCAAVGFALIWPKLRKRRPKCCQTYLKPRKSWRCSGRTWIRPYMTEVDRSCPDVGHVRLGVDQTWPIVSLCRNFGDVNRPCDGQSALRFDHTLFAICACTRRRGTALARLMR